VRTHVEFRSDAFPAQPGEEGKVNPGRWGKALALYLRHELLMRGFATGEPYAEDWGWAVPLQNDAFPLWVGCGNDEEHPDGFLVFIEPSKPYVRRWFRKVKTTMIVERVAGALDYSLRANPAVRDVAWWSKA
jgi:hypothetical protein